MFHIHQLPGRLRVRSAYLKGNESVATRARKIIPAIAGVTSININTLTGSILINYNTAKTHCAPILRELNRLHIITGILAFPGPVPRLALCSIPTGPSPGTNETAKGQLYQLRMPDTVLRPLQLLPLHKQSNSNAMVSKPLCDDSTKALISAICLTAGKILLLSLFEQSASAAAKSFVRKLL